MTKLLDEKKELLEGASLIQNGQLVAFRTETVYGLGADATNESACAKIFTAKNRPPKNPLIVHFHSLKQLGEYFPLDETTTMIMSRVKRALTVVLPRPANTRIATSVSAGADTVAVRVPAEKFARKFIAACGVPLAAPSANTSSRPSSTRWQDVYDDLNKRIDGIFIGKQATGGMESTVIRIEQFTETITNKEGNPEKVTRHRIEVLRLGGTSIRELERRTKLPVSLVSADDTKTNTKKLKVSPGTQFKHYAPSIPLLVLERDEILTYAKTNTCIILCKGNPAKQYVGLHALSLGNNPKQIATNLFAKIREAEKMLTEGGDAGELFAQKSILVEKLPATDVYATINERLSKASS